MTCSSCPVRKWAGGPPAASIPAPAGHRDHHTPAANLPFPVLLQVKGFQTQLATACCNKGTRDRGDGNRLGLLPDHSHLTLELHIPVQRQSLALPVPRARSFGCVRSAGSLCFEQRKVLPDGRVFPGCAGFVLSGLVMPKSIIHSRSQEGGSSSGSRRTK